MRVKLELQELSVGVEILNHCIKPPKTGREVQAENWSGGAPLQVFNVDNSEHMHVGIGPLLTAWSGLHPQAEAGVGA